MISDSTRLVNGLPTRFLSGGPDGAPTVVFIHDGAWGAAADVSWGAVLPLAAQRFQVVAPDLLGFGRTAKSVRLDDSPFGFRFRHVLALLDELGVGGPVHLVGNSFGGSLGLRALSDPETARRLASVTAISGTGGPWRTDAMLQLSAFDGSVEDIERIVRLLCDDFDGFDDHVRARHAMASMPGHYQAVMAAHLPVPAPIAPSRPPDPYPGNLDGVPVPTQLVACTRDVLLEPGWAKHLLAHLPAAEVIELDTRHSPNISRPGELWDAIAPFLDRVSAGA
jgi:pimeloyl-ACP methyl ester carboxylesterase